MASKSLLASLAIPLFGLALGSAVGVSCTVAYGDLAFRCNPRQTDNCPDGYFCCSDDAAPQFHGVNNANSISGMCVKEGAVNPVAGDPELPKCPIPCDPTWSSNQIAAACGQGAMCCQTAEITERDCVQDPNTGQWRPVTGADVFAGLSNWSPAAHDTHQDPGGTVCLAFAGGDQSSQAFRDCLEAVGVANRRGFCMAACPPENPVVNPNYRSPCDCLNNPSDPFCLQQ
ncbi:MAG: hypothetical protein D6705_17560 [Deltaproteobacteria bacterium]|nr:MAG: hypothetical protein D6705_17560 [Deltaproteobacteria bacterium]